MLSDVLYRMRALLRRRSVEAELDEELRAHLERQTEKYIQLGLPRDEAARRARVDLGGVEQAKEECRDARGVSFLETLLQDLRYGLRQLRRNPGFTAVAVITLALGIGANTAIFSAIKAVLLSSLPVENPQQLVLFEWHSKEWPPHVSQTGVSTRDSFSYSSFELFCDQKRVFSSVFAFAPLGLNTPNTTVFVKGRASLAGGEMVTGEYFSGLGVRPYRGRTLDVQDEKQGAPGAAVISYSYWTRQFARDPAAVGEDIMLDGSPYTIVGVAPRKFTGVTPGAEPDIWIPFTAKPGIGPWGQGPRGGKSVFNRRYWFCLSIMARLRPGVSSARARAAADTVFRNFFTADQNPPPRLAELPRIELVSGAKGMDWVRRQLGRPLLILMGAVVLVLLIACANVAALLLARAASRQAEISMRQALGASRGRLVRQLLTESILLALFGGAAGLALAFWLARGLETVLTSASLPIALSIRVDLPVLGFTAAVAIAAGILFGFAPAFRSTRIDLTSALREGRGGSADRGHIPLGKALVIGQIAVCLLLLIGAGLFVRTLENVENQNLGFNQQGLLLFGVNPAQNGYKGDRLAGFYSELLHRVEVLPGVQGATTYEFAPFSDWSNNNGIYIDGYRRKLDNLMARSATVGPDFFKTMGIPVLLGRGIKWSDTSSSPKVAVVTKALAHYFFGSERPIGRRFNIGDGPDLKNTFEIVGVVEDVLLTNLEPDAPWAARQIFIPFAQSPGEPGGMYYEVRTGGDPTTLVPAVRRTVRDLDPQLPLANVKTQVEQTRQAAAGQRLFALISGFFGLLALALACIGLYGTMSYAVARRTNEIGIRMALGAQKRNVLSMIVRNGVKLTLVGASIGIVAALGLTRFLASLLYGVKPTDPFTFIAVSLILIGVALLACYIPARRATKIDPMVALRYE